MRRPMKIRLRIFDAHGYSSGYLVGSAGASPIYLANIDGGLGLLTSESVRGLCEVSVPRRCDHTATGKVSGPRPNSRGQH